MELLIFLTEIEQFVLRHCLGNFGFYGSAFCILHFANYTRVKYMKILSVYNFSLFLYAYFIFTGIEMLTKKQQVLMFRTCRQRICSHK